MNPGRRHLGHAELQLRLSDLEVEGVDKLREITHFHVHQEKRGHGAGSRLLDKVCREADLNRKALMVNVKPYDKSERTVEQLSGWYQRHGFVPIQQEPEVVLVRVPR